MPSISLTVVKVRKSNGRVLIDFSDGQQLEFSTLAQAKSHAKALAENNDTLKKMALARYFFVDPNATNPALMEGKTITITNESNTMATVG